MRDDVEGRRLLRQPLEQHPGVLLRRPAEAEMVEREDATLRVDGHVVQREELPVLRPLAAPGRDKGAVGAEFLNPVVARVGDVEVARGVELDVSHGDRIDGEYDSSSEAR